MTELTKDEKDTKSAVMGNYGERSITLVKGAGVYVYDEEGKEYLDFTAGIAVNALGHAHPKVTEALVEQAGTLLHCSNLYKTPWQEQLAAKLAQLSGLAKVFFCNSGTEANEAAMKLARRYAYLNYGPDKTEIVSLPYAFHGRTFGALSITPKPQYQEGYQPLVPGCKTPDRYETTVDLIGEATAACIVEVVQGEGGVNPVPAEILAAIADRCKAVGALFIIDEVQTGVGRTGSFLAFQQLGLEPDIVTMAKGLGGGVPVGAVLARDEVAKAFTPGAHGSTFGGNPLAMAAGLAVTEVVSEPDFLSRVGQVGDYLRQALTQFGTDVTGLGLMIGMTVQDAKQFVADAASRGVLLTAVGPQRVRFVPPLVIDTADVDELVRRLSM